MKRYTTLLLLIPTLNILPASFQNLDFEQANNNFVSIDNRTGGLVGSVADLLPGWQLFQGTNLLESVGYGPQLFDFFGVYGASINGPPVGSSLVGNYSLSLFIPGMGTNIPDTFHLVQRATIPDDARLLVFTYGRELIRASINTIDVPIMRTIGSNSLRTVFADVTQFAGQNVELDFRTTGGPDGFSAVGYHDLDDIRFIPDVPEPSTWALFGLGGLLILWPHARHLFRGAITSSPILP